MFNGKIWWFIPIFRTWGGVVWKLDHSSELVGLLSSLDFHGKYMGLEIFKAGGLLDLLNGVYMYIMEKARTVDLVVARGTLFFSQQKQT